MAVGKRLIDVNTAPVALCALAITCAAHAADLAVPSKAFPTIQTAVDAAIAGDRVLVAPGIYAGRIDFRGKPIDVIGAGAATTVLEPAPGGEIVLATSGEPVGAALRGFTLRGATAGAITVVSSALEVTDCLIADNHRAQTASRGGAIGVEGHNSPATFALRRCVVRDNTVSSGIGGAAFIWNANAAIEDCQFVNNAVVGPTLWGGHLARGGAVAIESSNATVARSLFDGNAILTHIEIDTCQCCGYTTTLNAMGGQLSFDARWDLQPSVVVEDCTFRNGRVDLSTVFVGNCTTFDWTLYPDCWGGDIGAVECDLTVRRSTFADSSVHTSAAAPPLGSSVDTNQYAHGGALAFLYGALTVEECSFTRSTVQITQSGPGAANDCLGGAACTYSTSGVILRNTTFTDCAAVGPAINKSGGAVWMSAANGSNAIDGCTFTNCAARSGGAVSVSGVYQPDPSLTITGSTFRLNRSSRDNGGAVALEYIAATVLGSTFEDNVVDTQLGVASGGALFHGHSSLLVDGCAFRRNAVRANSTSSFARSAVGGAIRKYGGSLALRNSTFEGNAVEATGGSPSGDVVGRDAFGGACYADWTTLTLDSCAFTSNRSTSARDSRGGAVEIVASAIASIGTCDFTGNSCQSPFATSGGAFTALSNPAPFTVTSCEFHENTASMGAAIWVSNNGVALDLCGLERNTGASGEAVRSEYGAASSFRNTTVCGSGLNWASGPMADLGGNTVAALCNDCNVNGIEDSLEVAEGNTPDCNGNGVPDICDILSGIERDSNFNDRPDRCDADLSGDGIVGGADLAILLGNWGATGSNPADLDRNGAVSASDLSFLLVNWF